MSYYEKNKNTRLNYQKQYYRENKEEIKKYTKEYYALNKDKMKQKRKGNVPVKRKNNDEGKFYVIHKEVTLTFN